MIYGLNLELSHISSYSAGAQLLRLSGIFSGGYRGVQETGVDNLAIMHEV